MKNILLGILLLSLQSHASASKEYDDMLVTKAVECGLSLDYIIVREGPPHVGRACHDIYDLTPNTPVLSILEGAIANNAIPENLSRFSVKHAIVRLRASNAIGVSFNLRERIVKQPSTTEKNATTPPLFW